MLAWILIGFIAYCLIFRELERSKKSSSFLISFLMKFKHEKEKGSGRRKRHFGEEKNLDISISDDMAEKFCKYTELLLEWNEKMNLTAVTDPAEISVKHFLDSIAPLSVIDIKRNSKIIDKHN